jgi:hypothetical protein
MLKLYEVMKHTDWHLLKEQKAQLLQLRSQYPEMVDGLLHWIDAIQDAVVADAAMPERTVFPKD